LILKLILIFVIPLYLSYVTFNATTFTLIFWLEGEGGQLILYWRSMLKSVLVWLLIYMWGLGDDLKVPF